MALHPILDTRKNPPLWRIFARAPGGKGNGRIAYDEHGTPLDGGGYATESEAQSRIDGLHPVRALQSEASVYMQARAKHYLRSLPAESLPPGRREDPVAVAHHHGVDPLYDSMPSLAWMQEIEQAKQNAARDMLRACQGDMREAQDAIEDAGRWTAAAESMRGGIRGYLYPKLQSVAVQNNDSQAMSDEEARAIYAEIQRSVEAIESVPDRLNPEKKGQ